MITFKARKLEYQDTVLEHTTLYIEDDLKSRLHSLLKIIGINESYFYSMKLPTQLYFSSLPSSKRDFLKFQM